jgi:putative Holliday junction resolvase
MIPPGRVLGVDHGSKRIGVAVTDSAQRIATGVTVLARTGDRAADHRALADLAASYQAVGIVVGLPLSLSGRMGPAAETVVAEVAELQEAVDVEVVTVDERLTTRAAAGTLHAEGRNARAQRGLIDQNAAALLLQTWVEQRLSAETTGAGRMGASGGRAW